MTVLTCSLALSLSLALLVACINAAPPGRTAAISPANRSISTPLAAQAPDVKSGMDACPQTEAVWAKPPDDAAVQGASGFGSYFVNEDRSIWAPAWWASQVDDLAQVRQDGIKVGWFRPAGATLAITGQRIDAQVPLLHAHVPCCYPTRFQATGLFFPTEGCWAVQAKAADRMLAFVAWVAP